MEIRILSAGKEIGPYSESQVRQYLGEGLVAPSDLATCNGLQDWISLEQLLANLPRPATTDNMQEDVSSESSLLASESVPMAAETAAISQKARRNPIVMQPIFAPDGSSSGGQKKTRSGKTALNIEPPRPTTQLPPVAKFIPKEEKKNTKNVVSTGPLSPGNFFEKPVSDSASQAPNAPPEPIGDLFVTDAPPPAPVPDVPRDPAPTPSSPAGKRAPSEENEPLPNAILYASTVIGLLVLLLVLIVVYLIWHLSTPAPRGAGFGRPSSSQDGTASANVPENPQTAAEFSARGYDRQNHDDLDGALADYDKAVQLDPRSIEALYRRALARQTKRMWDGAMADYNALLTLDPDNAEAFSNRGYVKQARGDVDGAFADYAEALLRDPKMAIAYYNIGLIKVQRGDIDGGIDAFNRALDLDPKLTLAYYNRGNAKSTEGNFDGAIADYTQTIALDPGIAMAYFCRGYARQSKGDAEGATGDYSQAIAHDPKLAAAYYNRGQIEVLRGDFEGAIADSGAAIELDPKNAQAYFNRGLAQIGKGGLEGATTDLHKYCEMAPRDSSCDAARLYLWVSSMQLNPKGTANDELATALENDWNSSPEDLTSKIAAFLLGHIRENEVIADATSPDLSREPGRYCKVWYYVGMKHLVEGDTATALADLQKSLATGKSDVCEYLFARAEVASLGQSRQASSLSVSAPTP
jgi:tetratricopeptide (TPR) repeat protein